MLKNFALIGIGEGSYNNNMNAITATASSHTIIPTKKNHTIAYNNNSDSTSNHHNNSNTNENNKDNINSLWNIYNLTQGGILITDMDNIERSNLNRQLLFREIHIGQSKSLIAAEQIKKMNPYLQVVGITNKLSIDTEHVFNSTFWNNADIIATALVSILIIYKLLLI